MRAAPGRGARPRGPHCRRPLPPASAAASNGCRPLHTDTKTPLHVCGAASAAATAATTLSPALLTGAFAGATLYAAGVVVLVSVNGGKK